AGDSAERRAALRALGPLGAGPSALPMVATALRTHDPRLVAAALGPYAARYLDAHAWRHGVLTCLHRAIPLRAVAGLARRADTELARMAAAYVRELTSAGRPVPADARMLAEARGPAPRPGRPGPAADPHPAPTPDEA
ncbi:EboA domain-containing protein, partial [Streptomyces sp. B1866]|uniref:EboA domain-containing protein n=1 Tax=Streptomyces sp. B1866 TaxID=3075431 RepID=UPI00288D23B0